MTRRKSNNQWSVGIASHPAPKIPSQKFAGKFLASFFLGGDQDGVLLIYYLPKRQTINAEYYSSLLVKLEDILKEKHHGKLTKVVLFLNDIAPAHWAPATLKKLAYLRFQYLYHPPFSPDLSQSDCHLLPGLKNS